MRLLVTSGALSAGLYAAALFVPDWGVEFTRFAGIYVLLAVAYGLAVWRVGALSGRDADSRGDSRERRVLAVIWIGAVVFRVLGLWSPPSLSDDLYRYLWDGHVLLEGINPYRYAPSAPELSALRDASWSLINNPGLPTIYPPFLILIFAGVAAVSPTVLAWKTAVVLFDLAAGFFWMRCLGHLGKPRTWAVLYLWHPLVVIEFASSGHADAVGVLLVVLACCLWAGGRWFRSGVAWTLAGLVKFLPWVALPLLARRLGWRWFLLPLVVLLFYGPFLLNGADALGSLGVYAAKWRSNDFLFSFVLPGSETPTEAALRITKSLLAVAVTGVWVALILFRRPLPAVYSWTVGVAFLLSPVVHPWYVLWLLPALLFLPHVAWWVWSLTVFIAYIPLSAFKLGGAWVESPGWKTVEYLPVLVLLPVQLWLELRRSDRSDAQ